MVTVHNIGLLRLYVDHPRECFRGPKMPPKFDSNAFCSYCLLVRLKNPFFAIIKKFYFQGFQSSIQTRKVIFWLISCNLFLTDADSLAGYSLEVAAFINHIKALIPKRAYLLTETT